MALKMSVGNLGSCLPPVLETERWFIMQTSIIHDDLGSQAPTAYYTN